MKNIQKVAMVIMACLAVSSVSYAKITKEESFKVYHTEIPVKLLEERTERNQELVDTLVKSIKENAQESGAKAQEREQRLQTTKKNTITLLDDEIKFSKDLNENRIKPLLVNQKSSVEYRKGLSALRDRVFACIDKLNNMKQQLNVPLQRSRGGTVLRTPQTLPAG